ncbi:hypothetical protein HG536_0B03680 [Torulaspora globosa]|uniref:Kinetochore-associated protein n=1 Tax=Torulaspora globosa TaxID=48254 RepID=A0A7G3ZDB9_9SACH|nr:uncharacterized protein HG536_0B03680 [Torulaspora globosa]QLL31505.1 hypothetical protein HG536_0B03680 [Torulaspora globosa]
MTSDAKIRYLRLNQVFNKALGQSISKLESWEKVSSCFPKYASTREGASNLVNCQRQVKEFWMELCKREFEEILSERNVKQKLDELDDLISEAKQRLRSSKKQGSETQPSRNIDELSSEELIQCNLYNERQKASEQLDVRLTALNDMNKGLQKELNGLVETLNVEQAELSKLYDRYLGSAVEQPLDETLVQGLGDMLSELREV